MSEQRSDWLFGRTVSIAANRALRPNEFGDPVSLAPNLGETSVNPLMSRCAFCSGHEGETPPAVYEHLDGAGRWQVRVIPNKYPAVDFEMPDGLSVEALAVTDRATVFPATGAHEVIIESARHVDRTSMLSVADLRHVLETYAARLRCHRESGRFKYGLVFKNQGPRAGASMAHLHSQLVALPNVPAAVQAELCRAEEAFTEAGFCPYCRLLEQERNTGARIVFDRDGYVAVCPFASTQPHEVWLLPAAHESSFERMAPDAFQRLAAVLHVLISRLESLAPVPSFNLMLRTAPWTAANDAWFHWRIELLPRVNSIAGLEIATGIFINPLAPERAAEQLRTP